MLSVGLLIHTTLLAIYYKNLRQYPQIIIEVLFLVASYQLVDMMIFQLADMETLCAKYLTMWSLKNIYRLGKLW